VSGAAACREPASHQALRCRTASSLWERFRGLMWAAPLPAGEGVWFPRCSAVHTAFVHAAIDLLFLHDLQIVKVCDKVPPWRIALCAGADSVVELRGGEARRLGLTVGQRLEIETTSAQAGRRL
jgi:uncharacterized membrane protein (UPF0127 family)